MLKKGKVHSNVSDLAEEMRRAMEPHTARKLRERAKNTVKDYVSVSSILGVTHLLVFTQTDKSLSLRICRTPTGPTLTFKVQQFSLMRHVRALQKRPVEVNQAYKTSPLVGGGQRSNARTAVRHAGMIDFLFVFYIGGGVFGWVGRKISTLEEWYHINTGTNG